MPVIISERFTALTGTVVGDPTVVQIGGGFVPVIPVGSTELFPTLDPATRPFMLVDVKTLLEFIETKLVPVSFRHFTKTIESLPIRDLTHDRHPVSGCTPEPHPGFVVQIFDRGYLFKVVKQPLRIFL